MNKNFYTIEDKAQILIDSLPYIRDFNQKIIIISFGCSNILTDEEEQEVMRDIALLKSIGMKPIVVHDTKMGHDKFRENKRIAKMIEFCGIKAVGICGIDLQTLHMTLDNDYIPVITPNDIDNEDTPILPEEAAQAIAVAMGAEKVLFLGKEEGIRDEEGNIISQMTYDEVKKMKEEGRFEGRLLQKTTYALQMIEQGVPRIHILGSKMAHSILVEIFSIIGVGTVIMPDREHYYPHELKRRKMK
ncbi:MAG: acetylglutamate kinase [Coprococcus sp.]